MARAEKIQAVDKMGSPIGRGKMMETNETEERDPEITARKTQNCEGEFA